MIFLYTLTEPFLRIFLPLNQKKIVCALLGQSGDPNNYYRIQSQENESIQEV